MCDACCLEDNVRASWRACGMPRRVLIGLSGGADSVCLLALLARLREREDIAILAAHVHHGLREGADGDAAFCEALCRRFCIPYRMERVRVPKGASLENQARQARHDALEHMRQAMNADVIALAHHADDQAETLLMHMARGAGLRGLCGMRALSGNIWRPLLGIRRRALRVYLEGAALSFRTDETNASPDFLRNALRLRAMPALEACLPDFVLASARAATLLQRDEDCLRALTERVLKRGASLDPPHRFILLDALKDCPPALQARALRMAYELVAGTPDDLDLCATRRLLDCLNGTPGATANLPGGWRARRSRTRIHLLPPMGWGDPPFEGDWRLDESAPDGRTGDGLREQLIGEDVYRRCVLRTRLPGDTITPFGAVGSQKLKQYLIDRHVDEPFRADWPLLACGSRVVWVIGVGAAEDAAVRDTATPCRFLTFWGRLPGETLPTKAKGDAIV